MGGVHSIHPLGQFSTPIDTELAVVCSGGGLGALDEHLPEGGVAAPGSPATAFSRALVVARADPGPGGAVSGRGEHADVRAQFDEDGAGAVPVDDGNGAEQVNLRPVPGQSALDLPVVLGDAGGGIVEGLELVVEHEAGLRGQFGRERVAQRAEVGAHVVGQAVKDVLGVQAAVQPLKDAQSVGAEQVGEDAPPTRAPAASRILWTRLRIRARSRTTWRRGRETLRRARKRAGGTRLALHRPNWQMRASRAVAAICILCTSSPAARAWTTCIVSVCTIVCLLLRFG